MQYSNIPDKDLVIKNVAFQDIPKIIELQKESFPSMLEEGSVWGRRHLQSHVEIFPEGQFCVELDNKIIGSSSSLIIKLPTEYEVHTFSQATGNSLFTTHDPNGDSLYGADISVHPKFRRLGIATMLYKARKDLVIKYNLRRIIAGGRLINYCNYVQKFSPEEYVQHVLDEQISDQVLTFQLKNEFKFIKILPNYIKDSRSLNYATFIEWINPYYKK
ncbi:MAG TPA: GNAT family N-acetyltransferase [Candidatus Nitrosocosmicus sp.]|jgi:ribosomal protein S18 acetylase RimI-like enzyme|nr:GNAT family N-acetyltransferase [Candidatus Nitrosocosmicus sp.]